MGALKNRQHELFCLEFLKDLNKTAAYARAGYKARGDNATSAAIRLTQRPEVQARIKELQEEREKVVEREGIEAVAELEKIGYAIITDYLEFSNEGIVLKASKDLTRDQLAAIESVEQKQTRDGITVKLKLFSKTSALEMLCRHHGLFNDKLEIDGVKIGEKVFQIPSFDSDGG